MEWTTAYVNDLPDSSFAWIQSGGSKDEEGKTTPRDLRHFPFKDAKGDLDRAHVANAIARIPQSNAPGLSDAKKSELQDMLRKKLSDVKGDADDRVLRLDVGNAELSHKQRTPSGGLVARANLTRTGVFEYQMPNGTKRRGSRHPDEVFHPATLASFKNAPVTIDHPGQVTTDNWKTHAVGHIPDAPVRDGDYAAGTIALQDGGAVHDAESGKAQEVSCGYTCGIDPTPGEYKGQKFDVRQTGIEINHVAIGPKGWGRMGPNVRMHLDSACAVGEPVEDAAGVGTYVPSMTPEELAKKLAEAEAAKKVAQDAEATARNDAATAKTDLEKATAALKVSEAALATARAEKEMLTVQVQRQTSDAAEAAKLVATKAQTEALVDETIAVREKAHKVLGAKWKHDGLSNDAIRLVVIEAIEPTYKTDSLKEALAKGNSEPLRAVYDLVSARQDSVEQNGGMVQRIASTPLAEGHEDAGDMNDDDDDEEPTDAEAERKKMNSREKNAWKGKPTKDKKGASK